MIKPKTLAFSIFGASATWEVGRQNKELARKIISRLEDRRLLFGERGEHLHDSLYCLESAVQIRTYLGEQLQAEGVGETLAKAIQEMRRACRRFIDRAGPGAATFERDRDQFIMAATELRTIFGFYVAALASKYGLAVDDDLASILPLRTDHE